MEKRKTNYFKEITSGMDLFLAGILGVVFAFVLHLVQKLDIIILFFNKLNLPRHIISYAYSGLKGAGLFVVIAVVVSLFVNAFKRYVHKLDFVLILADFFVLTMLITTAVAIRGATFYYVVWGIALAFLAAITAIRFVRVNESSNEAKLAVKDYMGAIARKYNFPLIVGLGTLAGSALFLAVRHLDVTGIVKSIIPALAGVKVLEIVFFLGFGLAALWLGYCLITVMNGRRSKVSIADAIFFGVAVAAITCGYYFTFDFGAVRIRQILIWAVLVFAAVAIVFVRSACVDSNIECDRTKKNSLNYYGAFFEKYSFVLIAAAIFVFAGTLIHQVEFIPLAAIFAGSNAAYTLINVAFIVYAIASTVALLVRGSLKSDEINLLDVNLFGLGMVGVLFFQDILFHFTAVKFVIWLLLLAAVAGLTALRVKNADLSQYHEVVAYEAPVAEEVAEEIVEETPVVEETVEEVVEESPVVEEVAEEVVETKEISIHRHLYTNKLKFIKHKTKVYYDSIKNLLLSYGIKNRISKKNESFRKKGLVAKISVSGKTLRVHLPLDPTAYDVNRYHQLDLSAKRAFKDVPFTLKVKSDLGYRRALELINSIIIAKGFKLKKGYEPVDFVSTMAVDGEAIFDKLNLLDKLTDSADVTYAEQFNGEELPTIERITSFIPALPTVNDELNHRDGLTAVVTIDDALLEKMGDAVISTETLKAAEIIGDSIERINIVLATTLTRSISVVCDEIDLPSAIAILALNGKIAYYTKRRISDTPIIEIPNDVDVK